MKTASQLPLPQDSALTSSFAPAIVSVSETQSVAEALLAQAKFKAQKTAQLEAMKKLAYSFRCPLNLKIFHDPVRLDCPDEDGHHLERAWAEQFFAQAGLKRCPCCKGNLTKFTEARLVRETAQNFRQLLAGFLVDNPEAQDLPEFEMYTPDEPEAKASSQRSAPHAEAKSGSANHVLNQDEPEAVWQEASILPVAASSAASVAPGASVAAAPGSQQRSALSLSDQERLDDLQDLYSSLRFGSGPSGGALADLGSMPTFTVMPVTERLRLLNRYVTRPYYEVVALYNSVTDLVAKASPQDLNAAREQLPKMDSLIAELLKESDKEFMRGLQTKLQQSIDAKLLSLAQPSAAASQSSAAGMFSSSSSGSSSVAVVGSLPSVIAAAATPT